MDRFRKALADRTGDPDGRRWLFVPEDQLTDRLGPLAREDPRDLGILLVESRWKASLRPYHRQRLALVWANQRWFALEQATRGVAVRYETADGPYRTVLRRLARELGTLRAMEPAEREMRADLAPLVRSGALELLPHEGWLTTREQFRAAVKGKKAWRMDSFYRRVRKATGVLMRDGKPEGGRYSFDPENRLPWKGDPPAVAPPSFPPDPVKEEVAAFVEDECARHPGRLDPDSLPATREDAETLWSWAKRRCLPHFGPYEDAMSVASRTIFHTRISALLNLHRLIPRRVVEEAARLRIPLRSQEGFVRQVLGWREFVRHVHEATDGFRETPSGAPPVAPRPGDGGWARWARRSWKRPRLPSGLDGGAAPSFLEAGEPLPPAFWGAPSGLACLDEVARGVWEEGYGHHITRLMVLSNLATLLGVSPRELTDWFWAAYTDAWDWVVEPNVLGMGTFATGDLMTTKPYVSGAAYIHRMSDYCSGCAFDPKRSCPITPLYWAFLARNRKRLRGNARLRMPLASLGKRGASRRRADAAAFETLRAALGEGRKVEPEPDG
jgi:deoxyribodipyrimidine photolyase-related protein